MTAGGLAAGRAGGLAVAFACAVAGRGSRRKVGAGWGCARGAALGRLDWAQLVRRPRYTAEPTGSWRWKQKLLAAESVIKPNKLCVPVCPCARVLVCLFAVGPFRGASHRHRQSVNARTGAEPTLESLSKVSCAAHFAALCCVVDPKRTWQRLRCGFWLSCLCDQFCRDRLTFQDCWPKSQNGRRFECAEIDGSFGELLPQWPEQCVVPPYRCCA